jgi:hypothetical protein
VSLRLQPDRPALSLGTVPKPSFRQNHQNSQKGTPATPSKSSPSRHPKSVITLSPLACAFAKNTRVGPSNPSRSSQHPANFELTPPHTITNCFVSPKNLTLVFPSHCELFCKNTRGGVSRILAISFRSVSGFQFVQGGNRLRGGQRPLGKLRSLAHGLHQHLQRLPRVGRNENRGRQ